MKKYIPALFMTAVFISPAAAADGFKIGLVDLSKSGRPSNATAVSTSVFSSESKCMSQGTNYCIYLDLCGDRYWVPEGVAKMVNNHLGPVGRGLQIWRNGRTVCVAGKRPM